MTCKRTDLGHDMISWSCSRRQAAGPPCDSCKSAPSVAACGHKLVGAKAGKSCGRRLCKHCAITVAGVALCPPHANIARKTS